LTSRTEVSQAIRELGSRYRTLRLSTLNLTMSSEISLCANK